MMETNYHSDSCASRTNKNVSSRELRNLFDSLEPGELSHSKMEFLERILRGEAPSFDSDELEILSKALSYPQRIHCLGALDLVLQTRINQCASQRVSPPEQQPPSDSTGPFAQIIEKIEHTAQKKTQEQFRQNVSELIARRRNDAMSSRAGKTDLAQSVVDACQREGVDPDACLNRYGLKSSERKTEKNHKHTDLLFYPAIFAMNSLPVKDPGTDMFTRRNGLWKMVITGGPDPDRDQQKVLVPYGKIARAGIIRMATVAKLTGERKISLGESKRQIQKTLQAAAGGQAMKRAQEQINRLHFARVTIIQNHSEKNGVARNQVELDSTVLEQGDFLWDLEKGTLEEGSFLVLSPSFYENICLHSIPLCPHAASHLLEGKGFLLAFDLYAFLCHRVSRQKIKKGSLCLPWKEISAHLGNQRDTENPDWLRNYRRDVKKALEKVYEVWPGSEQFLACDKAGLQIDWKKASPHVLPTSKK